MNRYLLIFHLLLICLPTIGFTEEKNERRAYRSDERLVNCTFYRSKKNSIPVYAKPDLSSEVVGRLSLGEEVCYVGERQSFAIIDWRKQEIIRSTKLESKAEEAFVRLVDLWEPRGRRSKQDSMLERARGYYDLRRSGVVPEDPLGPFRPMVDTTAPMPTPEEKLNTGKQGRGSDAKEPKLNEP